MEETWFIILGGGGRLEAIGQFGQRMDFDTTDVTFGKGTQHRAKANVWTRQGDFIVGVHEAGKLHHSSYVGGGLVR